MENVRLFKEDKVCASYSVIGCESGVVFASGLFKAKGEKMVICWNQHDTLQTKADLLDKMEDLLLTVSMISPASECEYCLENSQCPYGSVEECIRSKAKILATKAKELT